MKIAPINTDSSYSIWSCTTSVDVILAVQFEVSTTLVTFRYSICTMYDSYIQLQENMACLWKLCKPKKTEYVPFCPHDTEGVPLVPLLTPKTRKRVLLSWCKVQDNGLLFVGNTMFKT